MITLEAILNQLDDAQYEHRIWNAAVKKLALADADDGAAYDIAHANGMPVLDRERMPIPTATLRMMIVARLDGCERELIALNKVRLDLISHGRSETPCDAPEAISAHMTPDAESAAT